MKSFYVLLALAPAVAFAACPNACNGRGDCGASDVCACYEGWSGGDCSYRDCPYGASWVVTDLASLQDDRNVEDIIAETPGGYVSDVANLAISDTYSELYPKVPAFRQYTECSSRGTCDYSTGECKCFPGYEGKGCRRSSCPNDCSGHGRCLTNSERNSDYTSFNSPNDQFWDKDRTQSCACDRGFTGYDCSQRVCPSGDNPTTDCGDNTAEDYQLVYVALDSSSTAAQYFSLTFTDMFGGSWTTRPISADKCTAGENCREVQYALLELPNFAIPDIEADLLDVSSKLANNEQVYLVHFDDQSNVGKQNTMSCNDVSDPDGAGSSPKFNAVLSCAVYDVGAPEWFGSDGSEDSLTLNGVDLSFDDVLGHTEAAELQNVADTSALQYKDFVPCSNQGSRDREVGACTCNDGHYGASCGLQNVYA